MYQRGSAEHWQHAPERRADWMIASEVISARVKTGKILDVGCFDGQFLKVLGGNFDLAGIEIHPEAARRAEGKGVRLIGRDYHDLHGIFEQFDAVVAFDVIEHTADPLSFLDLLSRITTKGGVIIVATGNTEALPWRIMGSRYAYCAVAEHISFVNPSWCKWAANRLALAIVSTTTYCHSPVSLPRHIAGIAKSLLYRVSPDVIAWLRTIGLGSIDVRQRPTVKTYPPSWHGAVDHFVTVFRKQ